MALLNLRSRRFWLALGLGVVLGGAFAGGLGPWVRARVAAKAARLGLSVRVATVVPRLSGLELRGVVIEIPDVPGLRVKLPSVIAAWDTQRPERLERGRVTVAGKMGELVSNLQRWRQKIRGKRSASAASSGNGLTLVSWTLAGKGTLHGTPVSLGAKAFDLQREGAVWTLDAASFQLQLGKARASGEGLRLAASRADDGRLRLEELSTRRLDLAADEDLRGYLVRETATAATAKKAAGVKAPDAKAASPSHQPGKPSSKPHSRVLAARRWLARLDELQKAVRASVNPKGRIALEGARASVVLDGHRIQLGPGTFGVEQRKDHLAVELLPDLAEEQAMKAAGKRRPLTFRLELPSRASKKALVAELRGGPVALSTLGIRDGFWGLQGVAQTVLQSDAAIRLSHDGEHVKIQGNGRIQKLGIANRKLAAKPLTNLEVAWRGAADIRLDGNRFELRQLEFDLGDLRAVLNGKVWRNGGAYVVDMNYRMPLVSCQRAFESVPAAMVPLLKGMRLAGSVAVQGHARFDMSQLASKYDVDWRGALSCRVVEVPAQIDVKRFKRSFEKVVYSPDGRAYTKRFRNEDDSDWTPLQSISRYMVGAVITCEDYRFFRHNGFDKEAIVNSLRENLKAGRFVRGASTVSMQLAKNLYLTREKTLSRKLQEAILTLYLEQALTKNEMMELYLNIIEYGPDRYGITAAAKHFFNTSPSRLSLGQSMYFGSILRNPKKHFFGGGGQVVGGRMGYLRRLMKVLHKIRRISDEELDLGLRETVIFGGPSHVAPPEDDPYAEENNDELGQPDPKEG